MKAIVQDRYGPVDVLTFKDIDSAGVPGESEVRLKVHAAGVDRGVWHLMTGLPYLLRLGAGMRAPKVPVRGMDVAGTVDAVGPNVTGLRPGDAVYGTCNGSFAESAVAKQDKLAPMPANLTFDQAAAVPISGTTALHALRDKGNLQPGQRVLIIGASGGVGSFAVQLAKALGAEVTGVCGTSKADFVRSLGADEVIDYRREDFASRGPVFDLIIDIAGLRTLSHLRRALTPKGTLVIVGGEGGGKWFGGIERVFRAMMLSPFIGQRLIGLISIERTEDLLALKDFIEAGAVTPAIGKSFPLAEAAEAVRYLQEGHARGKVVLSVAND
jgi:NADPH:quinone reductase-like Zn-dependent oxidoreductase